MKPLVVLLAAALLSLVPIHAAELWKAGAASVAITPEADMPMAGYANRTGPSEGKVQDLFAKALVIEDSSTGTRLVIVTLDLIGVPRDLRLSLERRTKEAYGMPREGLLLNASHTHCGPEFRVWGAFPQDESAESPGQRFGGVLEEKVFTLIGAALQDMAPARLVYSRGRAGFAMNRRLPTASGFANSPYPDGPVDHDVPVLSVQGADGKLRALLFGYACHATTLGIQQFCGDYPGYAQEFLQADHPGVTALFLNGCSGDQNPYPRRELEYAKRHGRTLAMAVEAALTVVPPRVLAGPLRTAFAEVTLDYSPAPTRAEFEQRLIGKDKYAAAHARRMLARLDQDRALPSTYPFPVQVVHFGDGLVLTALGGETTVDYSLRLKKELAGQAAVWIAGYSNDVMGYIPSRRVREEGGYEGGDAMRYSTVHPGPWAATLEEKIVAKVHELHRHLQSMSADK
jgi:hypothetical protein